MAGGTIVFLIIMVGILLLGITIFLLGTIFLIIRILKRHSNIKMEKKLTIVKKVLFNIGAEKFSSADKKLAKDYMKYSLFQS